MEAERCDDFHKEAIGLDVFEVIRYHRIGDRSLCGPRPVPADSYEILQALSSGGTVRISDRVWPLTPGEIYLIRGALAHGVTPDDPDGWMCNGVRVKYSYIRRLFPLTQLDVSGQEMLELTGGCFPLNDADTADADRLFYGIYQSSLEASSHSKTEITEYLLRLLLLVMSSRERSVARPVLSPKMLFITQYIRAHLAEELTLDRVAAEAGIRKDYLCRLFRMELDATATEYIFRLRLDCAKQQLIVTDLPVTQVAYESGFCNTSHFCRLFRRQEGMSPGDFRRTHRLRRAEEEE